MEALLVFLVFVIFMLVIALIDQRDYCQALIRNYKISIESKNKHLSMFNNVDKFLGEKIDATVKK